VYKTNEGAVDVVQKVILRVTSKAMDKYAESNRYLRSCGFTGQGWPMTEQTHQNLNTPYFGSWHLVPTANPSDSQEQCKNVISLNDESRSTEYGMGFKARVVPNVTI